MIVCLEEMDSHKFLAPLTGVLKTLTPSVEKGSLR